jgi:hypothetical protein
VFPPPRVRRCDQLGKVGASPCSPRRMIGTAYDAGLKPQTGAAKRASGLPGGASEGFPSAASHGRGQCALWSSSRNRGRRQRTARRIRLSRFRVLGSGTIIASVHPDSNGHPGEAAGGDLPASRADLQRELMPWPRCAAQCRRGARRAVPGRGAIGGLRV